MAKAKSGGGITSNKLVNVGLRTGSGSKGSSPAAASQLGQSTAFRKEQVDSERGYSGGGKYGNELATNVGKGGPGAGRTVMRSGSQGTYGAVVNPGSPPARDTLREYGPERKV
jgi:hypothetical protein